VKEDTAKAINFLAGLAQDFINTLPSSVRGAVQFTTQVSLDQIVLDLNTQEATPDDFMGVN